MGTAAIESLKFVHLFLFFNNLSVLEWFLEKKQVSSHFTQQERS